MLTVPSISVPRLMVSAGPQDVLARSELKEAVGELFADDSEVALFYFAGQHIETTGGYLCAGDCKSGDDGLALAEVMTLANKSKARSKIILLDSCYSGALGARLINGSVSEISEGMTILTASTEGQYAAETNGGGVFTGLLIHALSGAAANLLGDVTPGPSTLILISHSVPGAVFKTNVKQFISLRRAEPPLALQYLRRISVLFPRAGFEFKLDPAYEPTHKTADLAKNAVFAILQQYNRVNLLIPVGAPHMWHAAVNSKTVKLTALGEHYRRLAAEGLI
jgi:Caspase domain